MTRRSILGKQIWSVVFRHELIIFVSPSPNVQGAMNKAAPYCHRYDFLVRLLGTDLIFRTFLKLYFLLGLITTPMFSMFT